MCAGDRVGVLVTSGVLCVQAIVSASELPLSIIIVGVGNADFSAMEELDGDVVRLTSNGRQAKRDIVQFVPFRDFLKSVDGRGAAAGRAGGGDPYTARIRLAREVLAEVPGQFLSFMKDNGVKPGTSRRPDDAAALPVCPTLL